MGTPSPILSWPAPPREAPHPGSEWPLSMRLGCPSSPRLELTSKTMFYKPFICNIFHNNYTIGHLMLPTLHDRTTYGSGGLSDCPFSPPEWGQIGLESDRLCFLSRPSFPSRHSLCVVKHSLSQTTDYGSKPEATNYGFTSALCDKLWFHTT